MVAYYNEKDPYAAQWLRNLVAAGHIAPGDVDERDLWNVRPSEIAGYDQVHLCAGIGIWSAALRACGWRDDRRVWTASLPCQPFSDAGKGLGFADERHLWPAAFHAIEQLAPDIILGEQSASPRGIAWLELVSSDVENANYAFGAAITPAAGFGETIGRAYHLRHRQYWVAIRRLGDANGARPQGRIERGDGANEQAAGAGSVARGVAIPNGERRFRWAHDKDGGWGLEISGSGSETGGVADSGIEREGGRGIQRPDECDGAGIWPARERSEGLCAAGASGVDIIPTIEPDGTFVYRPVEIGTFPLCHEDSNRVGKLRAYGNALDFEQAKANIKAVMEYLDG